MAKRVGLFLAVMALIGIASLASRNTASAATAAAMLCDGWNGSQQTGSCVSLTQDTPDLRTRNFDNRASAVIGSGGQIALYTDINYRGRCQPINPGGPVPLVSTLVGDNAASSVRLGPCLACDNNGAKIWAFNPSATGSGDFIGDVKVVAGGSSGVSCGSGWYKATDVGYEYAMDLNRNAGGAYVYLCIRKHNQPSFYDISAVYGTSSDVPCPSGDYYKVPGDLNKGAGGRFIYFCMIPLRASDSYTLNDVTFARAGGYYTTAAEAEAIATGRCNRGSPNYGWYYAVDTRVDLNRGAGGDFIYICQGKRLR
jgi:hypothetical protein